jgi:hypothetical protein
LERRTQLILMCSNVEGPIGPDTLSTVPLQTLNAFRDHGRVRGTTIQEVSKRHDPTWLT